MSWQNYRNNFGQSKAEVPGIRNFFFSVKWIPAASVSVLRRGRCAASTAEPSPSQHALLHFNCPEPSASPANSCQASFNGLQAKLDTRKEKEVCWSVNRAKAVSVTSFHLWPCSVRPRWGGREARCIPAHGSHHSQTSAFMYVLLAVAVPLKAACAPL